MGADRYNYFPLAFIAPALAHTLLGVCGAAPERPENAENGPQNGPKNVGVSTKGAKAGGGGRRGPVSGVAGGVRGWVAGAVGAARAAAVVAASAVVLWGYGTVARTQLLSWRNDKALLTR